jgi:hypothetical protein
MPEEGNSATIPWLSLITLVCVSTGLIFFFPQLTSSRPGGGDSTLLDKTFGDETVNARLWQDSLGVCVEDGEGIPEIRPKKFRNPAHSITRFQQLFINRCFSPPVPEIWTPIRRDLSEPNKYSNGVQILAVMIPGGPYVEDVERRLRSRRAVLEALGSSRANRGLDPKKDHEIGYFSVPWPAYRPTARLCAHFLETSRDTDQRLFQEYNRLSRQITTTKPILSCRGLVPYPPKKDNRPSLLIPYEWCDGFSVRLDPAGGKLRERAGVGGEVTDRTYRTNRTYRCAGRVP